MSKGRSPRKSARRDVPKKKESAPRERQPQASQPKFLKRKVKVTQKLEMTEKQTRFIRLALIDSMKMMFVPGPAGTSKTYLSIYCALELLNKKCYDGIIYIRSVIESADGKLGFLPGEEEVKMAPYLRPLRDKLADFLTPTEIAYLHQEEKIQCEHVGFSRGQDWRNKIVIVDEAQNLTKKELTTLTTRMGENSKLFVIGDPQQSDIGNKSGFWDFYKIFNDHESEQQGIFSFEFDEDDIVRSKLVKFIVNKLKQSDS